MNSPRKKMPITVFTLKPSWKSIGWSWASNVCVSSFTLDMQAP